MFTDIECKSVIWFCFRQKEMEESNTTEDDQVTIRRRRMPRQVSMISDASEKNKSFKEWLASIFTMSDTDIISRCGLDALQYLRFQRHIICYVTMTTVLTISIILPLNFQGMEGFYKWLINTKNLFYHSMKSFGRTILFMC